MGSEDSGCKLAMNIMLYLAWKERRVIGTFISIKGMRLGRISKINDVGLSTGIEREDLGWKVFGRQFSDGAIIEVRSVKDIGPVKEYYVVINGQFHPFAHSTSMDETLEGDISDEGDNCEDAYQVEMSLEDIAAEARAYTEEILNEDRPNPYRSCIDCGHEFGWDNECPSCSSLNVAERAPDDSDDAW